MLLLTLSFTPRFGSVELGLVVNYSNICVSLPSAVGTFLFVMREKKVIMEGESHSRVGWAEPISSMAVVNEHNAGGENRFSSWDKEKKIIISHEESSLRPSNFALRCSTTEPQ